MNAADLKPSNNDTTDLWFIDAKNIKNGEKMTFYLATRASVHGLIPAKGSLLHFDKKKLRKRDETTKAICHERWICTESHLEEKGGLEKYLKVINFMLQKGIPIPDNMPTVKTLGFVNERELYGKSAQPRAEMMLATGLFSNLEPATDQDAETPDRLPFYKIKTRTRIVYREKGASATGKKEYSWYLCEKCAALSIIPKPGDAVLVSCSEGKHYEIVTSVELSEKESLQHFIESIQKDESIQPRRPVIGVMRRAATEQ